jgi:hypothetical protein
MNKLDLHERIHNVVCNEVHVLTVACTGRGVLLVLQQSLIANCYNASNNSKTQQSRTLRETCRGYQ